MKDLWPILLVVALIAFLALKPKGVAKVAGVRYVSSLEEIEAAEAAGIPWEYWTPGLEAEEREAQLEAAAEQERQLQEAGLY